MGVVPVTVAALGVGAEILLTILHHPRHKVVVVVASTKQTGNRCRSDRRSAADSLRAVLHSAFGKRAVADVLHRFVDNFFGDRYARIAATAQTLNLSDG